MKIHILHVPGADEHRDAIVADYRALGDLPESGFEICVHEDPDRRGIMPNWLDAVQCALDDENKPRWSLVIQDDAVGSVGWEEKLEEALWYSPAPVLGMSYFGQITDGAQKRNIPYLTGPHLIWGAAVGYRRDFLEGLVPWARWVYETTGYQHDDRLISAYANKIGVDTALTTRALFDQPVEKSTVGHGGGVRRPLHTLGSTSGAPYSARPRSVRKASSAAADQRQWLAKLGTPEEDTSGKFVTIRSGAVKWVPAEVSA